MAPSDRTGPATVAVQGELGSNSELAAHAFFTQRRHQPPVILPCRSFADLFQAVRDGAADCGMAPVDNSLVGSIHEVWDLLIANPLPIAGEVFLHVRHFLIGRPGARLADIRRVYSHEQALAQCQVFLSGLTGVHSEIVYDTAGAVAMIREEGDDSDAAIAPSQAARDHGMLILAEDIQSDDENYTRFLVVGRDQASATPRACKTTIVFRLGDDAGALAAALDGFSQHGIALEKVESRKALGCASEYLWYLEFGGSTAEAAAALNHLRERVDQLWVVGSYPIGTKVEPPVIER